MSTTTETKEKKYVSDYPNLMAEWDWEKNNEINISPYSVPHGSNYKVWWKCLKGHSWSTSANHRARRNRGCPYCAGKKPIVGENDLCTTHPELVKEWNYSKNGDLLPEQFMRGSNKKVWWICKNGHEWCASIYDRTLGHGCHYCTRQKPIIGENDLCTTHPALVKEWNYSKNGDLFPQQFMRGSGKKVWWICENGHEWEADIKDRAIGGGCPYCSNQKVLQGYNDLATTHPELVKEWHPTKNGTLTPNQLTHGSKKKVWWICKNGHEWEAIVSDRIKGRGCPVCSYLQRTSSQKKAINLATTHPELVKEWNYSKNGDLLPEQFTHGSDKKVWWICNKGHEWEAYIGGRANGGGCPYCSNKKVLQGYNDLATIYPELAKEWHPTKNGQLTPNKIAYGSGKKAWWICENGHEWEAQINNRRKGVGCPVCSNKKVLQGYNDLATTHPELVKEWHPTKNGALTPYQLTYGSGKKVWWQCKNDHEWEASISNRTKGRGCPVCYSRRRTSFPEQAIYYYVKKVFPDAINGYRGLANKNSMEIDIYIPEIKVGIEYDGRAFHYKDINRIRDQRKYSACKEKGIVLIRITDNMHPELMTNCDHKIPIPEANDYYLGNAISYMLHKLNRPTIVNIKEDRNEILKYLGKTDLSLEDAFPEIAAEWNYEKNGDLLPSMFHPGSNEKVWWKCSVCSKEWKTSLVERTGKDHTGCPVCSTKKGAEKLKLTNLKRLGSLAEKAPHLLEEWDYEKNKISPENIAVTSDENVWWKCKKCGYNWHTTISHRVKRNSKCPCCINQAVVEGINDLVTTHPALAKEWNYEKNSIQPTEICAGSNKRVWWKCSTCGHEWNTIMQQRKKEADVLSVQYKNARDPEQIKKTPFSQGRLFYFFARVSQRGLLGWIKIVV